MQPDRTGTALPALRKTSLESLKLLLRQIRIVRLVPSNLIGESLIAQRQQQHCGIALRSLHCPYLVRLHLTDVK
jgi:hypothetical protein